MKKVFNNKRRGIAIAVVLVFCVGILGLVTVLVMNTRFHRGSHAKQFEQTRALMAAKSAMQLAIYKFRVLPSEFYKIHEIEKALALSPANTLLQTKLQTYEQMWLRDLNSEEADTPAAKIKDNLNTVDMVDAASQHSFRIEEFKLVSRQSQGYIKDFVKIRAVGTYANTSRVLEELIEVKVVQ